MLSPVSDFTLSVHGNIFNYSVVSVSAFLFFSFFSFFFFFLVGVVCVGFCNC